MGLVVDNFDGDRKLTLAVGLSADSDVADARVQDSRIKRHGTAVDADLRSVAAEIGGGHARKQVVVGENGDIVIEADKHLIEIAVVVEVMSVQKFGRVEEGCYIVRDANAVFVIQASVSRSCGVRSVPRH